MAKMWVFCIYRFSRYMGNCCPGKKPDFQDHLKWLFSGPPKSGILGTTKKGRFFGSAKKGRFFEARKKADF